MMQTAKDNLIKRRLKGSKKYQQMLKRWEANTVITMDSEQRKLQYCIGLWYHVPQSNLLCRNPAGGGNVNT